jgi:hypothetical protein
MLAGDCISGMHLCTSPWNDGMGQQIEHALQVGRMTMAQQRGSGDMASDSFTHT